MPHSRPPGRPRLPLNWAIRRTRGAILACARPRIRRSFSPPARRRPSFSPRTPISPGWWSDWGRRRKSSDHLRQHLECRHARPPSPAPAQGAPGFGPRRTDHRDHRAGVSDPVPAGTSRDGAPDLAALLILASPGCLPAASDARDAGGWSLKPDAGATPVLLSLPPHRPVSIPTASVRARRNRLGGSRETNRRPLTSLDLPA